MLVYASTLLLVGHAWIQSYLCKSLFAFSHGLGTSIWGTQKYDVKACIPHSYILQFCYGSYLSFAAFASRITDHQWLTSWLAVNWSRNPTCRREDIDTVRMTPTEWVLSVECWVITCSSCWERFFWLPFFAFSISNITINSTLNDV
jgi:hypothetical protein